MPELDCSEEYAPEAREPEGFRRSDEEIAREIAERLADDVGLDANGIDVSARHGEVTLRGTVRHCGDIRRAEGHACSVAGVTRIKSELVAQEEPIEPPDPAAGGAAAKMGKPRYEA
jgi:osmotically-inducible protein OsmY